MRKLGLLLGLAAVACTAYGASPQFTYADIAAGKFAQRTVAGLRSMADGEHYTVLDSGRVVVFSAGRYRCGMAAHRRLPA